MGSGGSLEAPPDRLTLARGFLPFPITAVTTITRAWRSRSPIPTVTKAGEVVRLTLR
jgi:hypothetical protein